MANTIDRAKQYREEARRLREVGKTSTPAIRQKYEELAQGFEKLAEEIETNRR
jgi:hypothetical protein